MHIFIAILSLVALIVAHEFGHFIVAKWSGMRVDEFGIGYPPRALLLGKRGETEYTLNWLPFGGFVKIYGENGEQGGADARAFGARPRVLQALVLVAGITMNLLVAYVLITVALVSGTPRALDESELARARGLELAVSAVLPASPAAHAGLLAGDSILRAHDAKGEWAASDPKSFSAFIAESGGAPVVLTVKRAGAERTMTATPMQGVSAQDPSRYAVGVEIATIGIVPLGLLEASIEGAKLTWGVTVLSAEGLWQFFSSLFHLSADLSQVAGPVGITVLVGSASTQGIGSLLSIIAMISVSLALINLVPVPALDGGRLLMVIVEGIIRRPISVKIANGINMLAFALLIPLMLVISANDVVKLFH